MLTWYVLEDRLTDTSGVFFTHTHTCEHAHTRMCIPTNILLIGNQVIHLYHNMLLPQFCCRDAMTHRNGTEEQEGKKKKER